MRILTKVRFITIISCIILFTLSNLIIFHILTIDPSQESLSTAFLKPSTQESSTKDTFISQPVLNPPESAQSAPIPHTNLEASPLSDNSNSISTHPTHKKLLSQASICSTSNFTPISYGYTHTEARILFKKITRIPCSPISVLKALQNGTFQVNCLSPESSGVENSNEYIEKIGKNQIEFNLKQMRNGQKLNSYSEYHMVRCVDGSKDVVLRNVRNETLVQQTKQEMLKQQKLYQSDKVRPLTVVLFIIDSASRQLVYRNLPETIEYLNSVIEDDQSGFAIYDFLLNSAVEPFTVPNIIPLSYGISLETFEKLFSDKENRMNNGYVDYQRENALWSHFKKMGFVTIFSSDAVSDGLSIVFGKEVLVDHQISNFWKIGKEFFKLNEFKDGDVCIGSHPPHYYTLSYLQQVMKNYSGLNKFMFAHINTAHETTGSRLNIADKDFVKYFKEIFETLDRENEDFVFMLVGDHGTSKGDFVTTEGLAERVLASHFLIVNKELVERLKGDKNLKVNTERPVSRYDWYKTLKFLAYAPYASLEVESKEYKHIQSELEGVSVFHEEVDERRTCEDLGVKEVYCLHKKFFIVPEELWEMEPVHFFVDDAVKRINDMIQRRSGDYKTNMKELTKRFNGIIQRKSGDNKIPLSKIQKVEKLHFNPANPQKCTSYLIQFSFSQSSSSTFLIFASSCHTNQYNNLRKKTTFITSKRRLSKTQGSKQSVVDMLWKIIRLSPLLTYSELKTSKSLENHLKYDHNLYLSAANTSCKSTCYALGLECNRPVYYKTVLEYVSGLYDETVVIGKFDSIEVIGKKIFVGRKEYCKNVSIGQSVCFCSLILE